MMSLLPFWRNGEGNRESYTNIINLRQMVVQHFFFQTSRLSRQFSSEGIKIPSPSE